MDILQKEGKEIVTPQAKEIQVSLNFISADIDFLRIIQAHPYPFSIISKFKINDSTVTESLQKSTERSSLAEIKDFVIRN